MRTSIVLAAASVGVASAQSTASLTFWRPGFQNNPSSASKFGFDTATYPAYASILTSNPSTTVFALGCPTSAPTLALGTTSESCTWANDDATYTIMDKTKHIAHQTGEDPSVSIWWSCDYDQIKTVMDCDMQIEGDVNDNTNGTVQFEFPDRFGNIVAFVTAEVVSAGDFGTAAEGSEKTMSGLSESGSATGLRTASGSPSIMSATQGSGSGAAAMASSTSSGNTAASTGAAAGFGVDAVRLVGLVGGAAFAAW